MTAVNNKKELFETMPVRKAIATMAIPTIISQLINLVYNVVDTFFIGRTGNTDMIAAVTVAFTLFMLTIAFSNLFGVGGGSLMARLAGKGEYERAKNVSAYAFYGAIIISLSYSLLIAIFMNPILTVLGASSDTLIYAKQYVNNVVVLGNLPIILSATMAHLIRNAGYSKQASYGLSLGGILNIAFDPLLMFVILPKGMEVFGAALATLVANAISCIFLFIVYKNLGKTTSLSTSLIKAKDIRKEETKELYTVGIPSAVLNALFDVANMFLNSNMARYGSSAVAALGIVMKVERLPNAMNIGICQAMMPIVGYNYSSGNRKRMNETIKTATVLGLSICAICIALLEIFAKPITSVFVNANSVSAKGAIETLVIASFFLRIRCLASPLQFMNYRSSFCMQAMGDGKDTLTHAFVREMVFYVPAMYILDYLFGMNGLVFSLIVGEGCGMILAIILLNNWLKKKNID